MSIIKRAAVFLVLPVWIMCVLPGADALSASGSPVTLHAARTYTYGPYEYQLEADGTKAAITKYSGTDETLSIPAGIGAAKVKSIGDRAFYRCARLSRVTIPEGVVSIGSGVFAECDNLAQVQLPESLETIENNAFFRCISLESIHLPEGLSQINQYAFSGCKALKSITLPESLEYLGDGALSHCTSLERIEIPERLRYLQKETFAGCTSLRVFTATNKLYTIGDGAFRNCEDLVIIAPSQSNSAKYARKMGIITAESEDLLPAW